MDSGASIHTPIFENLDQRVLNGDQFLPYIPIWQLRLSVILNLTVLRRGAARAGHIQWRVLEFVFHCSLSEPEFDLQPCCKVFIVSLLLQRKKFESFFLLFSTFWGLGNFLVTLAFYLLREI